MTKLEEYLERAFILFQAGRCREALQYAQAALGQDPEHPGGLYYAARSCLELGLWEQAEDYARGAVAAKPDSHDCHQCLSMVLRRVGRSEEALVHCLKVVELDPGHANHYGQASTLLLGFGHDKALAMADRGLEVDPSHVGCLFARSLALRGLGRKQEAIETLERTLVLDPEYLDAVILLGLEENARGRVAKAAELLRRALAIDPNHGLIHQFLESDQALATAIRGN